MQVLEDLFSSSPKQWEPEYCWQDREIRFDVHPKELKCRPSEDIIETMDPVEDTKVAWRMGSWSAWPIVTQGRSDLIISLAVVLI